MSTRIAVRMAELKAIGRTGLPVQVVDPGSGLASAAGARLAERGFPRHLRSNLALAAAAGEKLFPRIGGGCSRNCLRASGFRGRGGSRESAWFPGRLPV